MSDLPNTPPEHRVAVSLGSVALVQSAIIAELMRKGVFDHGSIEAMKTIFTRDGTDDAGLLAFRAMKPFEKKTD